MPGPTWRDNGHKALMPVINVGKYLVNINNYKGLQVITAVMIRTCMGVGCNYYEFELLAARSSMCSPIATPPARVDDGGECRTYTVVC